MTVKYVSLKVVQASDMHLSEKCLTSLEKKDNNVMYVCFTKNYTFSYIIQHDNNNYIEIYNIYTYIEPSLIFEIS